MCGRTGGAGGSAGYGCVLLVLVVFIIFSFPLGRVQSASLSKRKAVVTARTEPSPPLRPPPAKHGHNSKVATNPLPESFEHWSDSSPMDDGTNLWEHSGYLEGDIMTYAGEDRNGILNKTLRWPDAIVPFYIDEEDFSTKEVEVIMKAIGEYHEKTCIKFRPYSKDDTNWIVIKGDSNGCWSSVGMHKEGQVVNLHTPKCVQHGVVVHELLHALGFFHQQSSTDRDDYVKIVWENISEGHENNFYKYNDTVVTSYGVGYDYGSVMHYSSKAFSKNGNRTIIPLQTDMELGQRKGLSEKDILKLNKMYRRSCKRNGSESSEEDYDDIFLQLINLFG